MILDLEKARKLFTELSEHYDESKLPNNGIFGLSDNPAAADQEEIIRSLNNICSWDAKSAGLILDIMACLGIRYDGMDEAQNELDMAV